MKTEHDAAIGSEEEVAGHNLKNGVINQVQTMKKEEVGHDRVVSSLLPDTPPHDHASASVKSDEANLDLIEIDQKRSGSSRLTSPGEGSEVNTSKRGKGVARLTPTGPTQTAKHLPEARSAALQIFEEIKDNTYQNNKVGRSRGYEKEAMTCECRYRQDIDDPMMACGEDAGCINRLTQVECRSSDCNCGESCQNQRFQKHEYVDVEIIQTEKKGFGLRAGQDVSADRLIYEYIGEVVEQVEFMRRMQQYKDEGIRHYYFMMLQREEFLDATKKGGIARFINHSCNPNCYVSKWHVGKYMRMGIFSKRDILKDEELTFNYNVDRYGNEAQACYCGEPNCVGSIGGKTQTDIGGMDELFIDALGIAEEVERLDARGSRKKKSRHLDEDFNPVLKPMEEEEVAKVITAIRQATSNRMLLQKLLTRIQITSDVDVQRSLVQLHGFVLMAGILDEWKDDKEIVLLIMRSLAGWPLLARNKVVDSGVDNLIRDLSKSDDAEISSLASDLISAWDALEMSYRIARKEGDKNGGRHTLSFDHKRADDTDDIAPSVSLADARAPNTISKRSWNDGPQHTYRNNNNRESRYGNGAPRYPSNGHPGESTYWGTPGRHRYQGESHRNSPLGTPLSGSKMTSIHSRSDNHRHSPLPSPAPATIPKVIPLSIEEIIRRAHESEAAQRKQAEEAAAAATATSVALERRDSADKRVSFAGKKRRSAIQVSPEKRRRMTESSEAQHNDENPLEIAEKRLKKLIGEIVVRCMSTYKDDLDREAFKKYAKELTTIICEKEKRNPKIWPPKSDELNGKSKFLPDGFSSEKRGKIKKYAGDYVGKIISHKTRKQSSNIGSVENEASTSSLTETPGEADKPHATVKFVNRHIDDDEEEIDFGDSPRQSAGGSNESIRDSPASGPMHPNGFVNGNGFHHLDSAASTTTNTSTDQAAPSTPHDVAPSNLPRSK